MMESKKIELVKPEFIVGNEKRFFDFIGRLGDSDKIAVISHVADVDGIISAKITNKVLDADILKFVDYSALNMELVEELKDKKVNKIVITDLFIKNKEVVNELEKFSEVLIIDHHSIENDYNSSNTVYLVAHGFCASYLVYYLFSKAVNLEEMDWLAVCASIADWTYEKNRAWMKEVYNKYGEKFSESAEGIKKSKFWDLQAILSLSILYFKSNVVKVYEKIGEQFGDLKDLKLYAVPVQREIDSLVEKFDVEKIEIKEGYFYEVEARYSVTSIISNIISSRMQDKTIIIGESKYPFYKLSLRRQDGKSDMNKFAKKLIEGFEKSDGGGHFKASGATILSKDARILKERIKDL
ncbi:MAG: DHH family phosphoesterase [Nanoarchaeota archaeon]|mgnify:CR=1 FL=1